MATHAVALGASIQTAINAGAAGDTYTLAAGIYRGQQFTPKTGDIYAGDPAGTTLSGAALITSWTQVAGNWYRAINGITDASPTGAALVQRSLAKITGYITGAALAPATVTMTIASPCVVTWTGSNLTAGQVVVFSTTGALPTGVSARTPYYVIATGLTADTFRFSATFGGAAVNSSGSQSGTHTATLGGVLTVSTVVSGSWTLPASGGAIYGNGLVAGCELMANIAGSGVGSTWSVSGSQIIGSSGSPITMIMCDELYENGGNFGLLNDPLGYFNEELFVDGARYTRIQAAATPVAPAANQWFWDFSNNSVNILLASPGSHTIEYSQTHKMCDMGSGNVVTMTNLTIEKFSGFQQGAITSYPDGSITLNNCRCNFNKGAGVNLASGAGASQGGLLAIYGGTFNDNGENGIIGTPTMGQIIGAEIARNNAAGQFSRYYESAGAKLTGVKNYLVLGCNVHDNFGPGLWYDIDCVDNTIAYNVIRNNGGPGIMLEISSGFRVFNNTISGSGPDSVNICGCIYISNSSNVEAYNNNCTVRAGNNGRTGGAICAYNGFRGNSSGFANGSFSGSIAGTTLTAGTVTGSISLGQSLFGDGVMSGTYIVAQLTGSAGAAGTYRLNFPHPTISSEALLTIAADDNVIREVRNCSIHHNTITYLDNAGATDGFAVDQTIAGGSNNYRDFNTYYTPDSGGTYYYRGTDAGVNTAYAWTAYQSAGFEPNSVRNVGLPPTALPAPKSRQVPMFQGQVTFVALDISTVATGGTAVAALSAGHRAAGGWIKNPENAPANLGINEQGTATGTASSGATTFIAPGEVYYLQPSASAVSVISSVSGHAFSGVGWT
jgi:parallel beta-helix repeat protein